MDRDEEILITHDEVRRHPIWQREVGQGHAVEKPRARVMSPRAMAAAVLAGAGAWLAWLVGS